MKTIVSYGGGTDSTAMLIEMVKRGLHVDEIIFADTGGERQGTYRFIHIFNKWLYVNNFPLIKIVRYKTKEGVELTLEQDILNRETLPPIAFGFKTCSQKFKIRPTLKYIKSKYANEKIIQAIGFDLNERRRMKENPNDNWENFFPLIEWGLNRKDCLEIIQKEGLPLPNKSSCFYCPNARKNEILNLTEEEKRKVKAIEANAKNLSELKGLGRRFSWTSLFNKDDQQLTLFDLKQKQAETSEDEFEDIEMFESPCECID